MYRFLKKYTQKCIILHTSDKFDCEDFDENENQVLGYFKPDWDGGMYLNLEEYGTCGYMTAIGTVYTNDGEFHDLDRKHCHIENAKSIFENEYMVIFWDYSSRHPDFELHPNKYPLLKKYAPKWWYEYWLDAQQDTDEDY